MPLLGEETPPPIGVEVYTIQRPSGENPEPIGSADCTAPKGAAFLSVTVNVQREKAEPYVTANDISRPSGDQDSGMCTSPGSGFVRRSTGPEPSARCQKIAKSPSRSD